jgi:hypothetical protein
MKGEERRKGILSQLNEKVPVSAGALAAAFGVSRQIIVQDVALLRSDGAEILSTPKGYLRLAGGVGGGSVGSVGAVGSVGGVAAHSRVFKVRHEDGQIEEELSLIVGAGGCVKDVFVHHRVYGTLRAELGVGTPEQVAEYMRSITSGKSRPLKNVTDGYHYHTVTAPSASVLDEIESLLRIRGFLVERAVQS